MYMYVSTYCIYTSTHAIWGLNGVQKGPFMGRPPSHDMSWVMTHEVIPSYGMHICICIYIYIHVSTHVCTMLHLLKEV